MKKDSFHINKGFVRTALNASHAQLTSIMLDHGFTPCPVECKVRTYVATFAAHPAAQNCDEAFFH